MSTSKKEQTLEWVLIAKGIGIILVVIGHFYPDNSPVFWKEIYRVIYTFHMPLFFMLSGLLYNPDKYSYPSLMKNKIKRLIFPFFSIAILFLFLKVAAAMVMKLEHPVEWNKLILVITDPVNSYMPLLWFVHALFIMFLSYPLFRWIFRQNWLIFFIILVLVFFVPHQTAGLYKIIENYPFFVFGIFLGRKNVLFPNPGKHWVLLIISVVVFLLAYMAGRNQDLVFPLKVLDKLAMGISGSLTVIAISHLVEDFSGSRLKQVFIETGFYSMTIYLFHTFFESAVRIGFFQILDIPERWFVGVALIAIVSGIFFPLIFEKHVLRKNRFTRKFILGTG